MTKFTATTYATAAELVAAIKLIDNTATIQIIPYMEAGRQKFILIT